MAQILALPRPSSPEQIRAIVDTFTRELAVLDPAAPDAEERMRLYRHTIDRYAAWLARRDR